MQTFALQCLINKPTCHQSKIATCINLTLRNNNNLFKLSNNFETGLSDHHMLISIIMKSRNCEGSAKEKIYRSCKNFEIGAS